MGEKEPQAMSRRGVLEGSSIFLRRRESGLHVVSSPHLSRFKQRVDEQFVLVHLGGVASYGLQKSASCVGMGEIADVRGQHLLSVSRIGRPIDVPAALREPRSKCWTKS
jgi:hypothetical protein